MKEHSYNFLYDVGVLQNHMDKILHENVMPWLFDQVEILVKDETRLDGDITNLSADYVVDNAKEHTKKIEEEKERQKQAQLEADRAQKQKEEEKL